MTGGGNLRRWVLAAYRVRIPMYALGALVLFGSVLATPRVPSGGIRTVFIALTLLAMATLITSLGLGMLATRMLPTPPTVTITAPVRGRWLGLNSPATRVPSHGVRAYGQAYAIDLVAEPDHDPDAAATLSKRAPTSRPSFGGRMLRPAHEYPAFGQPVFAMISGTVVRTASRHRDHRARSNRIGLVYLMIEGMLRELGGPGCVIGNHVMIRSEQGAYATVAHLRRGSVRVEVGEVVTAGEHIGDCGNSGNSSEPHVHAQLADRAAFWTANGLPISFAAIRIGTEPASVNGLPADGEHFTTTSR